MIVRRLATTKGPKGIQPGDTLEIDTNDLTPVKGAIYATQDGIIECPDGVLVGEAILGRVVRQWRYQED